MPQQTQSTSTPPNTVPELFGSTKKQGCAQKPNGEYTSIWTPAFIPQEAINFVSEKCYDDMSSAWVPENLQQPKQAPYNVDIEHFSAPVVHPVIGETIR